MLSVCKPLCPPIWPSMYLSFYIFFQLYVYLTVYLSIFPSLYLSTCPSLSIYPPPCRKARQGVFDPSVWFPMFSMFSFRGPQPPSAILLKTVFRLIFVTFFRTLLLTTMWTKKSQTWEPQNTPKITKICKNSSSKRSHNQDLQKDSVWEGPNLEKS